MKPVELSFQCTWFTLGVSLFSALCAALLAACGGGSADSLVPLARAAGSEAAASTASVRLEGCVVDEHFIPRTGTTVRVLSGDGRLIGHATSDKDGLFRLQVPVHQAIVVAVEQPSGESLALLVGRSDLSVGACLRDPRA